MLGIKARTIPIRKIDVLETSLGDRAGEPIWVFGFAPAPRQNYCAGPSQPAEILTSDLCLKLSQSYGRSVVRWQRRIVDSSTVTAADILEHVRRQKAYNSNT